MKSEEAGLGRQGSCTESALLWTECAAVWPSSHGCILRSTGSRVFWFCLLLRVWRGVECV